MGDTVLERITEEEAIAIENDYDPIDAPPGPYTIQPDVPGKILWFSGAPGMGKSTSAQILARNDGYVYYEADWFASLKNPYVPLDVEDPSLAQIKQRLLKGPGVKERSEMAKTAGQSCNKDSLNFLGEGTVKNLLWVKTCIKCQLN